MVMWGPFLTYYLPMRKLIIAHRIKIITLGLILIALIGLWRFACRSDTEFEWGNEPYILLYLHEKDQTAKLKFEEYLVGAVAAEMPASFAPEALKAQAVCARTYAVKKLIEQHAYPHQADLSDDINNCQAYISPAEFKRVHPRHHEELLARIQQAVDETRGEIMLSGGEPIDAVYHSTCGGQTEDVGEVWLQALPYLTSVKCKYCSDSKHYSTVQVFSFQQIESHMGLSQDENLKIDILKTTSSGRIKELSINNKIISGEQFRRQLNLPSNWLRFETDPGKLTIKSRGYGHGVGMCQYGANGMAQDGAGYQQILEHYYQDIDFIKISYDVLE